MEKARFLSKEAGFFHARCRPEKTAGGSLGSKGGLSAAAPGYSSAPPSGSLVSGREPSMVQSVSRVKR